MRDDQRMRTTLDLDPDVLQAAKEIAATQGKSTGKVLSELARRGLTPTRTKVRLRNGVPLLLRPAGTPPLTMQDVNALRDDD
jgi:hypothetical protein